MPACAQCEQHKHISRQYWDVKDTLCILQLLVVKIQIFTQEYSTFIAALYQISESVSVEEACH